MLRLRLSWRKNSKCEWVTMHLLLNPSSWSYRRSEAAPAQIPFGGMQNSDVTVEHQKQFAPHDH